MLVSYNSGAPPGPSGDLGVVWLKRCLFSLPIGTVACKMVAAYDSVTVDLIFKLMGQRATYIVFLSRDDLLSARASSSLAN